MLRVRDAFGGVVTRTFPINALPAVLDPAAKFNVLVFSKTAAFRHSNIDEGITAIKLLGSQQNFTVDAIEDASLFTDAFLSRYDAVIWNSTTGRRAQRRAAGGVRALHPGRRRLRGRPLRG